MAPFVDVPCDAKRHVLSFLVPRYRHALRAAGRDLYETGLAHCATTTLRVPVDNRAALAACQHRARMRDAGPRFWGSLVDRVVLWCSRERDDSLDTAKQFCLSLAALLYDRPLAVVTVSVSCSADADGAHKAGERTERNSTLWQLNWELDLLAWLAEDGPWTQADIEVTNGNADDTDLTLPAARLGPKLRARLTRCDALLDFGETAETFPVLRNLVCGHELTYNLGNADLPARFPLVQHFIATDGLQVDEVYSCVQSFGNRPAARMTMSFGGDCGHILDELLESGSTLGLLGLRESSDSGPQNMPAAEVTLTCKDLEASYQNQDYGATNIWLCTSGPLDIVPPDLPNCVEMLCMHPYGHFSDADVLESADAIDVLLRHAPVLRRLYLDLNTVPVDRLRALPASLQLLDMSFFWSRMQWFRPKMPYDRLLTHVLHAIALLSARSSRGLPRCLLVPDIKERRRVTEYCQAIQRAIEAQHGDAPQVWLPPRTAWLYSGSTDAGPGCPLIRLTSVAITDAACTIHRDPPSWARGVVRIELRPPLAEALVAIPNAASLLAGAFCDAEEVCCRTKKALNKRDAAFLQAVCVALGPRLRLLGATAAIHRQLLPSLEDACPWLTAWRLQ